MAPSLPLLEEKGDYGGVPMKKVNADASHNSFCTSSYLKRKKRDAAYLVIKPLIRRNISLITLLLLQQVEILCCPRICWQQAI